MTDEEVKDIGVDARGRLFVRPADTTFDQIFRTATGVDWDEQMQALVSPEPREWPLPLWFEQILAATAGEYGVVLKTTPRTKWTSLSPDIQREIEAFSNSDWLAPLLSKWKENDDRYWRDFQLKQALSKADLLWTEGQYAEYIRILTPHRHELSPAQQKRLSIAEHRARG